ncbi:hypothetical protein B0J12DRAFT_700955 [Macrophomina phaseolina]|uniref:Acid phosphatase-like protein n=1 Tax=Macrophomina phaseolina TaxID=35725 RepID=A0ABQ8G5Q9_9PEZI|nr:hypothetical protein B0J12DRAFT_700955 [Macrophomina phaseolina]
MSGVGIFFLVLFLLLLIGGGAWIAYTRIRAQRLGLPPPSLNPFARGSRSSVGASGSAALPSPAPGGIVGWVNDKIASLKHGRNKNTRYAAGAYEESGATSTRGAARARGTLDPDEAWDARVGNEADYGYGYEEEQELGLREPTPYGGSAGMYAAPPHSAGLSAAAGSERGRSRTRELDERYDEEMGRTGGAATRENPFGDDAERSNLRGVSPRPVDSHERGNGANSPTDSRRSIFREDV